MAPWAGPNLLTGSYSGTAHENGGTVGPDLHYCRLVVASETYGPVSA